MCLCVMVRMIQTLIYWIGGGGNGSEEDTPIAVTTALPVRMSPAPPAGLMNEAPISVDRPVEYSPFVATASEPRVSVKDRMRPP
jgi:hypothetical protein